MLPDRHIDGDPLGAMLLDRVGTADVRAWFARLPADRPTWRAHAYRLLRAALNTAVDDELLAVSPWSGGAARQREVRPASLNVLDALTAAMVQRR